MRLDNVPAGTDCSRSSGSFLKGFAEGLSGLVWLGMLGARAGSLERRHEPGWARPEARKVAGRAWGAGQKPRAPGERPSQAERTPPGLGRALPFGPSLSTLHQSLHPAGVQRSTDSLTLKSVRGHWVSRLRPGTKPKEDRGGLLNFEQNLIFPVNIDFNGQIRRPNCLTP